MNEREIVCLKLQAYVVTDTVRSCMEEFSNCLHYHANQV